LLCEVLVSVHRPGGGFKIHPRINISKDDWNEEYLRLLGFHQKLKSAFRRKPYVFSP